MSEHTENRTPVVRMSMTAVPYLSMLDRRAGCLCSEPNGCGPREGGIRDRLYGHPRRYGLRTGATSRREDRPDPGRSLY